MACSCSGCTNACSGCNVSCDSHATRPSGCSCGGASCAGDCSSCVGSKCDSGCRDGCKGCSGGCDSCGGSCSTNCSPCTGKCTSCSGGCSGSCSGGCSGGCSGCSGGCSGCSGSCSGSCKGGCGDGCSNACTSASMNDVIANLGKQITRGQYIRAEDLLSIKSVITSEFRRRGISHLDTNFPTPVAVGNQVLANQTQALFDAIRNYNGVNQGVAIGGIVYGSNYDYTCALLRILTGGKV